MGWMLGVGPTLGVTTQIKKGVPVSTHFSYLVNMEPHTEMKGRTQSSASRYIWAARSKVKKVHRMHHRTLRISLT